MTHLTISSLSRLTSALPKVRPVGKFELTKFTKITNLQPTVDLENFLKTFKGAHGADHAASHIIYPENSGIEDSPMSVRLFTGRPAFVLSRHPSAESLATRPDAVSFTSGSTSTPPIIPDFPWRSQPSLAFELPNKDLSPEKGV